MRVAVSQGVGTNPRAPRALGALIRVTSRHGSILCFHGLRLNEDPVDSVMNLTLGAFRDTMDLVRASAEIIPLTELHARWRQGQSTRGLVAVTFDDAYHSLLDTADQWYTRSPFPLTIFVVTGASATGETFWWDRLEALASLLAPEERLGLEAACGMPSELRGHVDPVYGPLRALRQWILSRHCGRAPSAFSDELSRLESHHGRHTTQRAMRIEELRQMGRLGPVSFGVHTLSHPVLPLLSPGEAAGEIRGAWVALQEWGLPSCVPILAAPFGLFLSSLSGMSTECGMAACLVLNDRNLGRRAARVDSSLLPRWAMVQGTTATRLAFRLSGLRDIVQGGDPLEPPALPGALNAR